MCFMLHHAVLVDQVMRNIADEKKDAVVYPVGYVIEVRHRGAAYFPKPYPHKPGPSNRKNAQEDF